MHEALSELEALARKKRPIAAIVLGSGLNQVADSLPLIHSISLTQIPGMPSTDVRGHRGRVSLHSLDDQTVLVFQGRVHFYEGHGWSVVERPIRFVHELGIRKLILTNASGGISPVLDAGSLMAVRDQISAATPFWWRKPGLGGLTGNPASPYSDDLLVRLQNAARRSNVDLIEGVYAGVTGPNYETPAEIRAFQSLGADAIGMSTVREAETAAGLGMDVAGISCVANRAAGLSAAPLSHSEVLAVVASAAARMTRLLREFLLRLAD
jgi:purine-nucleoside phosphorylase